MTESMTAETEVQEPRKSILRPVILAVAILLTLAAVVTIAFTQGIIRATPDFHETANKLKVDSRWTLVSEEATSSHYFKTWTTGSTPQLTPDTMENMLKDSGFESTTCAVSETGGFNCSGIIWSGLSKSYAVVNVDSYDSNLSLNPGESRVFIVTGS